MSDLCMSNYRGAVYPLDLTAEPYRADHTKTVKTLLDICAHYIVRDAQATLNAVKVIPGDLCFSLMKAALLENRDRSVHVLISSWPFHMLSLKSLAPNLYASVLSLYNTTHQKKMSLLGVRFAALIAHAFSRCLMKSQGNMNLRYLDLTGFVSMEVVTKFMSSQCQLAHNQARQREVISMYEEVTKGMPQSAKVDCTVGDLIPEGCYGVKLDVCIDSVNAHSEICKALVISRFKNCTFKLYVNKLDATFLGEVKLKVLLDLVDPAHLTGLRLQFNSLGEHGILHLVYSISRLIKLTALDLSCNGIQFFHHQDSCDKVAKMLASLPNLTRLDLSNNRVKTRLRQLVANMPQSLEYLAVAGCCLTVSDVTYLSVSHHTSGLRELDLSDNWCVGENSRVLLNLLNKLNDKLLVLELQNCNLADSQVNELLKVLPSLHKLCFLNLSCNTLSWSTSQQLIKSVLSLPSAKALQISYPSECYSPQAVSFNHFSREVFHKHMTNLIEEHKSKTGSRFDLSLTG